MTEADADDAVFLDENGLGCEREGTAEQGSTRAGITYLVDVPAGVETVASAVFRARQDQLGKRGMEELVVSSKLIDTHWVIKYDMMRLLLSWRARAVRSTMDESESDVVLMDQEVRCDCRVELVDRLGGK